MLDAPCGWEATPCADCCTEALDALDPATVTVLADMAAWVLWSATGRRFGLCERVLRPCRRNCGSFWGGLPFPARIGGEWVNISCGTCAGACGCSTVSEFIAEDVVSILDVQIGDEHLSPDSVLVYDYRRVVRADGSPWPTCQDLGMESGPGTWSVTVEQGTPIPPGGEVMAGILLCELAKACVNDEQCRLPARVQNITRQGVSISFEDVFASLGEGRTGLFEVDLWITQANQRHYPASLSSIDAPRPSVLTWPLPESS